MQSYPLGPHREFIRSKTLADFQFFANADQYFQLFKLIPDFKQQFFSIFFDIRPGNQNRYFTAFFSFISTMGRKLSIALLLYFETAIMGNPAFFYPISFL